MTNCFLIELSEHAHEPVFACLLGRLGVHFTDIYVLCLFFFAPGETGIGKSTLMDTLFNTNFENFESSHFEPQVKLRAQTYDLQESNVRLRLTVVNTVGFGDQMNKQERCE